MSWCTAMTWVFLLIDMYQLGTLNMRTVTGTTQVKVSHYRHMSLRKK